MSVDLTTYDDFWGDPWSSTNGILRGGIYYYYVNKEIIKTLFDTQSKKFNKVIIPPIEAIQSVTFSPYIQSGDITFFASNFDLTRFPFADSNLSPDIVPYIFRIKNIINPIKKVGVIQRYTKKPSLGTARNYKYESKLQIFPFSYGLLTDGISEPILIKMENFTSGKNKVAVHVFQTLTNMGTFAIYVDGYKGDNDGFIEGSTSKRALNFPIVNNAYTNFMSTQQASYRQNMINAGVNSLTGIATGAIAGGGVGAAVGAVSGLASAYTSIASACAQRRDLLTSPQALSNAGSDISTTQFFNNTYLTFYRYGIREEYLKRYGDYFAKFGYLQNKLMSIYKRTRYYYNYVKTQECNAVSSKIPKESLEKIKAIYNNGITFWHMDREGVSFGNFSKDNFETYGNYQ